MPSARQRDPAWSRPIMIDLGKDGTLSYRPVDSGDRARKGHLSDGLPVFTVMTAEHAKQLFVLFGKAQYDEHPMRPGEVWYRLVEQSQLLPWKGDIDDMEKVTDAFRRAYSDILRREAANDGAGS